MKISVLTPSYNTGKYLERAIRSVIDQQYELFEHIIVDGGSKDNTLEICAKYDHLIWVSEPDKGQSDAMNKAFKMSTGDIIVYLNADDEFAANAFAEIVETFRSKPHKYVHIVQYWLNRFPNNPVSYFYTRKLQEKVGDFPLDDHYSMDIWFLLKAYRRFKIIKIDKVLGTFHSDGMNKTAVSDVGFHLHQVVKKHLKGENRPFILFFYFKFLVGRLKVKPSKQA
jgi:glycosyltransferase involved in cell wall biosynthesis